MKYEVINFISSSITGNVVGFTSLIVGIVSLVITIITLNSAKRIENEIKQEKIKAINKSKFIKHREEIVKDLRQKRNATKNQHRISFNLCLDILSTINDLLAYETIFEKNDYSKIVQSKEELNQIIEALKKERDKVAIYSKFDEVIAGLINILEKGEYDL